MNVLRYKKQHKSRIPNLIPNKDKNACDFGASCDSYGCDLIVKDKSINTFIPHYIFTPKLSCYGKQREINNNSNYLDFIYCKSCFEYRLDVKDANKIKRKKRISGEWTKDDYGYMENTDCDFCGEKLQRVKLREAIFTTNDVYCGIRSDTIFIIGVCNKCIKKDPKQVFKLVNTMEESNEHILSKIIKN